MSHRLAPLISPSVLLLERAVDVALFFLQLADRFPQLLWRHECIAALLDTIEALARRAAQGNGPPSVAGSSASAALVDSPAALSRKPAKPLTAAELRDPFGESDPIAVRGVPIPLEPPASASELADVLADVTELACQWLLRASIGAPTETRVAFHRYVNRVASAAAAASSVNFRGGSFAGLATGLYAMSPSAPGGLPSVVSHGMIGRARTAAAALLPRAYGITAESGLAATLEALSSAGVRVRWAGGAQPAAAGATSSGVTASGAAAGPSAALGAQKYGFEGVASTAALGGRKSVV